MNIRNKTPLRPPSPKTRTRCPITSCMRTCANTNAGACCSIAIIHMPTHLLRPQRVESAGGVRHRGSYTAPLGRRFEAGGLEVGCCSSGMCRSGMGGCSRRLLYPIYWGLRSYLGRSEAYEPVAVSCTSHPKECTQTTRPISKRNAARPPHAHPRTPITNIKPKYLPQTATP